MTLWQHVHIRYIRPAPAEFVLAAFILTVSVLGSLGALILGWAELAAAVVGIFTSFYILRGNAWKARALAAEVQHEETCVECSDLDTRTDLETVRRRK